MRNISTQNREKTSHETKETSKNNIWEKITLGLINILKGYHEAQKELHHQKERKHLKPRQKKHIQHIQQRHHQYQQQKKRKFLSDITN